VLNGMNTRRKIKEERTDGFRGVSGIERKNETSEHEI
jgi:hypothetical protein